MFTVLQGTTFLFCTLLSLPTEKKIYLISVERVLAFLKVVSSQFFVSNGITLYVPVLSSSGYLKLTVVH